MENAIKTRETISSLQVLRAIAAILVLFYHIGFMQDVIGYPYVDKVFWFGFSGVDLFFVLSGFIIFYTSYQKRSTLTVKEFLLKRFVRIYPIYWVAICATLLTFFAAKFAPHATSNSHIIGLMQEGGWQLILMSTLLLPFSAPPMVGVSWTLSFEVAFYLLFSLLFFRKAKYFMVALILWVVACYLNEFIFHVSLKYANESTLRPLLNPIVIEFLFGCIVAICFLRYSGRFALLALGSGLVLFTLVVVTPLGKASHRELIFGLPSALIVFGLAHVRYSFPRFLTYLGDASYSVYLFHTPILSFVVKGLLLFKLMIYFDNVVGVAVIACIVIVGCCFIYSYIENPLLRMGNKKIRSLMSTENPVLASGAISF